MRAGCLLLVATLAGCSDSVSTLDAGRRDGGERDGATVDAAQGGGPTVDAAVDLATKTDPCAGAMYGDGDYCGGPLGGDPSTLYHCVGKATAAQTACAMGCHSAPPGQNDTCTVPDPCAGATLGDGAYCGAALPGGDASTLYDCVGMATKTKTVCPMGCHRAPDGQADYCESPNVYYLPWCGGQSYLVTQGNNGDICGGGTGDHTGVQAYAWDFGLPRHTPVRATRTGTVTVAANVTGPGQPCYDGCTQPYGTSAFWSCCNGCINTSNHVNVAHGDGTVATYWHLDVATVTVGQAVRAGDVLGYSGTSGCSSGPHLHYQVMGSCPTSYCQSIVTAFADAGVPACGQTVTSQNACY